ncbi:MAG: response regulator transcription factor [Calditrichaeota bacterium]|nr:response regulator transcription factor [Calditrichota bacterium]
MGEDKILVAVENEILRKKIVKTLRESGFSIAEAKDGRGVISHLNEDPPIILFLDANLPEISGWEICRELKNDQLTRRIGIVLSAYDADENDRVKGLELGADDFINYPFGMREMLARVKALYRRIRLTQNRIKVRDIEIDLDEHRVKKAGHPIDLTYIQFKLLYLLASRRENVFSRQEILEKVWGHKIYVTNRTVDVHIKRLREKLGEVKYPSKYIETIHGVGYRFM